MTGCATIGETPGPPPPGAFTAEVKVPPIGTKWTVKETAYNESTGKTEAQSLTWTVMGEGSHAGKPVHHVWDGANIHVHDASTGNWIAVLNRDAAELLAHHPHDGQFSSPLWVGKSWAARFTRHERVENRTFYDVVVTWRVTAYEDVQVPAGTFKAFKVEAWPDARAPDRKRTYWYAPDIGLVVKETREGFGAPHKIGRGRDRIRSTVEVLEYTAADARAPGGAASSPSPSLAGPTTVPVEMVGNLTLVMATLNRSQLSLMLLDTGASSTILTPSQLARLGMSVPPNAPRKQIVVSGGRKLDVPFVTLPALHVGDAMVANLEVGVFDVMPDTPRLGGVLGGDFLQRFTVTLDAAQRVLRLEPLPDSGPAGQPAALASALRQHPDPSRRRAAALALARIAADSPDLGVAIAALLGAVRDPEVAVRQSAAEALTVIATRRPAALPRLLIESVRTGEPETRTMAILGLGMIGGAARDAGPVLLDVLKNDSVAAARAVAAAALGRVGPTVRDAVVFVDGLVDALRDADQEVRQAAATALIASAGTLVPVLEQDLRTGDGEARRKTAERLRVIGPGAPMLAIPVLVRALGDDDARVRSVSARGLMDASAGEHAGSASAVTALQTALEHRAEAVPAIVELVGDNEPEVRLAAIWLLGKAGARARGSSRIVAAALGSDTDSQVRAAAAATLGSLDPTPDSSVALVDALRDADPFVREHAASSLRPRAGQLVPGLEQDLSSQDADVRLRAVDTLGWIAPAVPAEVTPLLQRGLRDSDARVRAVSIRGLGATGAVALLVLTTALQHSEPGVRVAAAEAIANLGFRAVAGLSALIDALKDTDVSVRSSVVRGLGLIGSEATPALGALRAVAESDPSPEVRALAEAAIRSIAGR